MRPVPVATRVCPHCGHQWTETAEAQSRVPQEVAGQLVNVKGKTQRQGLVLRIAREARNLKQAIVIAKSMGYKHTEAYVVWTRYLKHTA